MKHRTLATLAIVALVAAMLAVVWLTIASAGAATTRHTREIGRGQIRFDGHGPEWWAQRARQLERQVASERARKVAEWRPTVEYGLRLSAAAFNLPLSQLRHVASCESGLDPSPLDVNGGSGASGLFQFLSGTWNETGMPGYGFSVFDPVADAIGAGKLITLIRHGSWSDWYASRGCWG